MVGVQPGRRRVDRRRRVHGLRPRVRDDEIGERSACGRVGSCAQVGAVEDVESPGLRRRHEEPRRVRAGGERDVRGRGRAEVEVVVGLLPARPLGRDEDVRCAPRELRQPRDADHLLGIRCAASLAVRVARDAEDVRPVRRQTARAPDARARAPRRPPRDVRRIRDVDRDDPPEVRAAVAVLTPERDVEDAVQAGATRRAGSGPTS